MSKPTRTTMVPLTQRREVEVRNEVHKMNTRTVLIVDDEQPILNFTTRVLQKAGCKTLSASEGEEALRLIGDHHVDCVLTDLVMPEGIGGTELFIALRRVVPSVPIVVMSGIVNLDADAFRRLAEQFGVKEILHKPFSAEQLLAAIDRGTGKTRGDTGF